MLVGAPVLFCLGVYVALANETPDAIYEAAEFAAASRGIILVGPLAGVLAALRSARLRSFLEDGNASRATAYLALLWPIFLIAPAAGILATISASQRIPRTEASLGILLVNATTVAACALLGAVVGRTVPVIVAVPIVGLGTFAWLSLPASGGNVGLRHMNSSFVGCCTLSQQPSNALIEASATLSVIVAACSVVVLAIVRSRKPAALAVVSTLILACTASSLVVRSHDDLNLLAIQPRNTAPVCSSDSALSVCVWPEHKALLSHAVGVYKAAVSRLASLGVDAPSKLSERAGVGYTPIDVPPGARDENLIVSLAVGMLPSPQTCKGGSDVYSIYDNALAWLSLTMGVTPQIVGQIVADADFAIDMLSQRADAQRDWFDSARSQLRVACS